MSRLIDWESVCLVCLQKGVNRSIFGEDNDSIVIADKIMKCADIFIKRDTNKPKSICLQCLDDLNVAYEFRRNCEQSDSIIKAVLNTNHQEFQIKDLWKPNPTTVNPIRDTCIKDEVVDNTTVDDSCENTPSLNLDDADTELKPIVEDRADCNVHDNANTLNNAKSDRSNKTGQKINCKIPRRSRGRPKKLSELSCAKPNHIVDNVVIVDTSENKPSLDLKDDPDTETKFVRADGHSNTTELNMKTGQNSKTKEKMKSKMQKRGRGRPKKLSEESSFTSSYKRPLKICQICNRGLRGQNRYTVHMRRHNNERPFSCDHCDKAFVTRTELRRHVTVHTGQKPLKCRYCDRQFSNYSVRKNHESTHTGERPYKCPTCNKCFAYSCLLTVHLRTHTGEKNFVCKECGKGFQRRERFEKHMAHHHHRYELEKSLEHKQLKRLKKEIFQIEENPDSNEIIIKHEIVDNAAIGDNCNNENILCPDMEGGPDTETDSFVEGSADANNATEVNNLEASENNKTLQKMSCEVLRRPRGRPKKSSEVSCAKAGDKSTYKRPLKICQICNRGLRGQNRFAVHMRRHNNERPFCCDQCDKAFVTRTELHSHIRVHTGQKRYKCQYCELRFSDYDIRKNHESIHTSERPYVCLDCGKSFAYSKGLTRHLRTHSDVKQFTDKGLKKTVRSDHQILDGLVNPLAPKQETLLKIESDHIEDCSNSSEININHEMEISHIEEKSNLIETNIKHEMESIEEEVN